MFLLKLGYFFPEQQKVGNTENNGVCTLFHQWEVNGLSTPKVAKDWFLQWEHNPQNSWLPLLGKTKMEINPASNTFAPKKVFLMQKMYSSRLQQFALKEVIFALIESTEFCSKTVH